MHLNLNKNTLYILSLVFMFLEKGFFTSIAPMQQNFHMKGLLPSGISKIGPQDMPPLLCKFQIFLTPTGNIFIPTWNFQFLQRGGGGGGGGGGGYGYFLRTSTGQFSIECLKSNQANNILWFSFYFVSFKLSNW